VFADESEGAVLTGKGILTGEESEGVAGPRWCVHGNGGRGVPAGAAQFGGQAEGEGRGEESLALFVAGADERDRERLAGDRHALRRGNPAGHRGVEDREAVARIERQGLVFRDPMQIEVVVNGGARSEIRGRCRKKKFTHGIPSARISDTAAGRTCEGKR
jgi:hypothetical protein